MRRSGIIRKAGSLIALMGILGVIPGAARAQALAARGRPATSPAGQPPSPPDDSMRSIDDDYARRLLELDRNRLERLGGLASRQAPADAAVTYEKLFRLAIGANQFREAESAAKAVVGGGSPSVTTLGLAHLVKVIAEADRGAYDQSFQSLRQAAGETGEAARGGPARKELPTDEVVSICDAYYQRLIQIGRFDDARKNLRTLLQATRRPALREYLASRLVRLDQVGRPAPPIRGTDLDGKPFDLAQARGQLVLVVFWASWSLPSAAEIAPLQQLEGAYRSRGLKIVGINLDGLSEKDEKPEATLANVRHFLLDYNVRWPTLINGQGDGDHARAYGVTEIPANVLIGKDGNVIRIDLAPGNLEPAIAAALGG